MPTVSTLSELTFSNLGPLTTTFTAPSSCSTIDSGFTAVAYKQDVTAILYDTSCEVEYDGWDCYPEGSAPSPTVTTVNLADTFKYTYFSPGIYCPSGWKTVGVASRDGDKPVTSSGAFANDTVIPTHIAGVFPNAANVLMQALDPSETAVLCCPSSMTGATYVGCYSTLPTVTPTSACERFYPEGDLTLISETYWYDGVTVVGEIVSLIATSPATSTRTYSISPEQFDSFLVAVSVEPMVTMIHKEEDVKAGTAATSNAAIRLGSRSSWDGIGGVAAVCALGMVLGAAIIVPL